MGKVTKINLFLIIPVLLEALTVLGEWDQVKEGWKQLEYIMTGATLVIGMDRSLIVREILLADLYGTKNTWHQVVKKRVILDYTSSLLCW